MQAALDEIIKFNCLVNEFNYMNDLAIRFKNTLMVLVLKSKVVDWPALFQHYDSVQK
jgi:hypothetical protein